MVEPDLRLMLCRRRAGKRRRKRVSMNGWMDGSIDRSNDKDASSVVTRSKIISRRLSSDTGATVLEREQVMAKLHQQPHDGTAFGCLVSALIVESTTRPPATAAACQRKLIVRG